MFEVCRSSAAFPTARVVAAAIVVVLATSIAPARAGGAIVNPEICDNCFDDDGNGQTDRKDPMCKPPADGGGQGIAQPSEAKGALKCQKAIEKASAAFALKKLGHLDKCIALAFACVQLKNSDLSSCLAKATPSCAKQVQAIPNDEAKAKAAIEKACNDGQGGTISLDDIRSSNGLGFNGEEALLDCPTTITSTSDLADCVIDRHECGMERLVVASAPRAKELLTALGRDTATEFPCLEAAAGTNGSDGTGAGLSGPGQGKAAVKCEGALIKAGAAIAKGGFKLSPKCFDAAATCVQLHNGDPTCPAKAGPKCQAVLTKFFGGLPKLFGATAAKCTGPTLTPTDLNAAAGLGFVAVTDPNKRCSQFTIQAVDPTIRLVECMTDQYGCDGSYMIERQVPRVRELSALLNVSLSGFGF